MTTETVAALIAAGGTISFQAFAQAVHTKHALLLDGFDGHKMHGF